MHKRLSKSLAILGVSLFASTTVLTTINSTQRYVAHADTNSSDPLTLLKEKEEVFTSGFFNRTVNEDRLAQFDQGGLLNYYKAGQAARMGTFLGLTHANVDTSQYNQNYINIAKNASQQAYIDFNNKVFQASSSTANAVGSKIPINMYNKAQEHPSTTNASTLSPEDFINNMAYIYTQRTIDETKRHNSLENDDYIYGFDSKITNTQNAETKYNYDPNSTEMNIPYDNFLSGRNSYVSSTQAINDAQNNTFTAKYIMAPAYIQAYVGYLNGKNNNPSIDEQAFYGRYSNTIPFKYAYHIGNNTPLRTIVNVDSNGKPQSVSKYSTFYSKDGLISNEPYSQSSNNNTSHSTPTASTTVVSPATVSNPVPVAKNVVHKKVAKKHVKKHVRKVVKNHVAKKSHGLFTIKVKASKIYAYKSTNFKNHKGRKAERKGTKLRVYGIVRKGHKTFYKVYGHRLITANKHFVSKIK